MTERAWLVDDDKAGGPASTGSGLSRSVPGRFGRVDPNRLLTWAFGLCGSLPTLVFAVVGPDLIYDDWTVSYSSHAMSWWGSFVQGATTVPARPGAALWYTITFGIFGDHPVPLVLLLAVVNGAVAVVVLRVALRLFGPSFGLWIALVWLVLPNRGSARFWIVIAPYSIATILVLVGVLALLDGRPGVAIALLVGGVVTYEGVTGLALAAIVVWTFAQRRDAHRRMIGVIGASAVGASALAMLVMSPKRKNGAQPPFHYADLYLQTQFGEGIARWTPAALLLFGACGIGVVIALVNVLAPGRRQARKRWHYVVAAGFGLSVALMVPFMAAGHPVANDGVFDRASSVMGLGTAVVIGGLLCAVLSSVPRPARAVIGALVIGSLALLNIPDLAVFTAATDGQRIVERISADVPSNVTTLVVCPTSPYTSGVTPFGDDADLEAALWFRAGWHLPPHIVTTDVKCTDHASGPAYDWTTRTFATGSPPVASAGRH